ncbi:MAG: hypothetical protein WC595_05800 [Candidatus Nanoarchaeia archaeon]
MNKRAYVGGISVNQLVVIPVVMIAAVFFVFLIADYRKERTDVSEQEEFIMAKVLRYSSDCLAYEEEGVTHPTIIDPKKIEGLRLASCYENPRFSYRVSLLSADKKVIKKASTVPANLEPLIQVCGKPTPTMTCSSQERYAPYVEDNVVKSGTLRVEVVRYV